MCDQDAISWISAIFPLSIYLHTNVSSCSLHASVSPEGTNLSSALRSDYNSKLFNGLELVMLVDILVFRFFLRNSALETVGWLGFFFLQVHISQG